ncbi:hypothetical protein Esi_0007_0058 [Ectocarpus siliculosus]|uniref:Uncharacterized protein n=1 Tax=Ectocarpus siliculosus TaxID=2880 RepID=D8LS04_ECTSI|nr:hypothetical protein Esi_0007_0058 [Ectocarpus siliculosus]|eukprot:CBN73788.1 hypothetical protein Esi_0007_0058 [Ectocarpus siliculosus]
MEGTAVVEMAEIAGTFEGNLTATKALKHIGGGTSIASCSLTVSAPAVQLPRVALVHPSLPPAPET